MDAPGIVKRAPRDSSRKSLWLWLGVLASGLVGCGGIQDQTLPPEVPDPTTLQTPAGALGRYRGTVARQRFIFEGVVLRGALFTDEMVALPTPPGLAGEFTAFDIRRNLEFVSQAPYDSLHMLRAQAHEARGFLATYAPQSPTDLQAHMFALEGYAEVFLADLFCSGVPLSTVDFDGDYTLASGSTTEEVYEHAIALFDSAWTLVKDSAWIKGFVAVGRGRALLARGRYTEAMAAVAAVPDGFSYTVSVPTVTQSTTEGPRLTGLTSYNVNYARVAAVPSVADREGGNGMDFRSSNDPRLKTLRLGAGLYGGDMYYPDPSRFARTGVVTYVLANGVEARLIEAEAMVLTGGDWLGKLNALRTTGTFDTQPNADDPTQTDTLWHAGSGGIAGLRPMEDPGTDKLRLDLLFRERAFWLYLTGNRAGDLRRLVRLYGRPLNDVYPVGSYTGAEESYGGESVWPVPLDEQKLNPRYVGCFHRFS